MYIDRKQSIFYNVYRKGYLHICHPLYTNLVSMKKGRANGNDSSLIESFLYNYMGRIGIVNYSQLGMMSIFIILLSFQLMMWENNEGYSSSFIALAFVMWE